MMRNEVVMKLKECVPVCMYLTLNKLEYIYFPKGNNSVREALKLQRGEQSVTNKFVQIQIIGEEICLYVWKKPFYWVHRCTSQKLLIVYKWIISSKISLLNQLYIYIYTHWLLNIISFNISFSYFINYGSSSHSFSKLFPSTCYVSNMVLANGDLKPMVAIVSESRESTT